MSLYFEQPILLVLLPPCLGLVYLLWRTARTYMPPTRRLSSLGLRMLVVTLLVLVLAGPMARLKADEITVAFLLDRSESVSQAAQAEQERWLSRALARKRALDQSVVIAFAEEASIERSLSPDSQLPRVGRMPSELTGRSNIAAAIYAGVGSLAPGAARRLVLLSDGRENLGDADQAAALASAAGVQLLTVIPTEQSRGPEVLVRLVEAPAHVREGERFSVIGHVDSTVPALASLHLLVDGVLAGTQEVGLDQGTNRFVLPVESLPAGHHSMRIQIEPEIDTLTQNNGGGAVVVVHGPASVLVVEGAAGEAQFLVEALRSTGLRVDVGSALSAPLSVGALRSYASVVLANVPATGFAPGQLGALKSYVQNFGGGLVVTGGEQAFGPGGYARTPLEDMLPVRMDLRGKAVSASTALVLVIDNSGSMGGGPGGATKMDLAKEAAIAAAELLGEYDQIGIVAFEDSPRWVFEPALATDLGIVQSAIADMAPGGGTEIHPALRMGYEGLAGVDARVKHIILLTDGQAPQGDYPTLAQRMKEASITLSTIAIGADADFTLLQNLASMGGGRYYEGNDPFDLPRLVVKETQQVQRAAIVEEEFRPIRIGTSPALEGIDTNRMPELRGYVATTPKPQSSVQLVSRQVDPILTEWQYGLGRVIAWTSDARNRWSSRWVEWPEFGRFWGQVVRRAARPQDDPNHDVQVRIVGNHARITLDAQTGTEVAEREYVNFMRAHATIVGPRGVQQELALPQVAPGRYEALVPVEDDGAYALQVTQRTGQSDQAAVQAAGFIVPYSPEYRGAGVNEPLLESLALRAGGRVIRDADEAFTHDLPAVGAPRPLWPSLLIALALLFVLDVGVRRIRISGPEMRGAYYRVRKRLGLSSERTVSKLAGGTSAGEATMRERMAMREETPQIAAIVPPPSSTATSSSRLLAAKQRAIRRS